MLRNRELRCAIAAALGIIGAAALLALVLVREAARAASPEVVALVAAVLVLGTGAALTALFTALTSRRYHELARMAERVDEALHGNRDVTLSDMREGELSILASEVDKALTRLTLSAEELASERTTLADSLADISHQLRTPLTSLGLTLALARKEASRASLPALLEHLRTSERLLAQMQWLVGALLKLARIDAGTVRLTRELVDVERLSAEAAEPLAIRFDIADVRLERSIQPGASFVGDAAWTREALENVLKNCLEHTPAGGHVRISATEDAIACRITVTDTGPGIAEEDLPHVFERFYRGCAGGARNERPIGADAPFENDGPARATRQEPVSARDVNPAGVGIGLSLAQSLVTAQDGRIVAGNEVDAEGNVTGARFDIVFFKAVV